MGRPGWRTCACVCPNNTAQSIAQSIPLHPSGEPGAGQAARQHVFVADKHARLGRNIYIARRARATRLMAFSTLSVPVCPAGRNGHWQAPVHLGVVIRRSGLAASSTILVLHFYCGPFGAGPAPGRATPSRAARPRRSSGRYRDRASEAGGEARLPAYCAGRPIGRNHLARRLQ